MQELTEQEQKVLDLSAEFWNAFCELPKEHPHDIPEALIHIHALQNMILARPLYRKQKEC
jgi:hypothetical protein